MPKTKPYDFQEKTRNRQAVLEAWRISEGLDEVHAAKRLNMCTTTYWKRFVHPEDLKVSEIMKMKLPEDEAVKLIYGKR